MYLKLQSKAGVINSQAQTQRLCDSQNQSGKNEQGCRVLGCQGLQGKSVCFCLASLGPTWESWEDSSGGVLSQSRQQL